MSALLTVAAATAAVPAKTGEAAPARLAAESVTGAVAVKADLKKADAKRYDFSKRAASTVDVKELAAKSSLKAGKSKVNKTLPDGGYQWKSLGQCDFTDAISVAPYMGDVPAATYKVDIEESEAQPGYFRLTNLTENNPYIGEDMLQVEDLDADSYIIINAVEEGYIIIEDAELNLLSPEGEKYYVGEPYESGVYEDGVINFPMFSFMVTVGCEPWDYDNMSQDNAFVIWEDCQIVLPGATPQPKLELLKADFCGDNDDKLYWMVKATLPEGGSLKYSWFKGKYGLTEANFQYIANKGLAFPESAIGGVLYSQFDEQNFYTLFVSMVDADGNYVKGVGEWFYIYGHKDDEWKSAGEVTLTDDTFGPVWGLDDEPSPVKVQVLENVEKPGLYRLVNPYAKHDIVDAYPRTFAYHTGHNHYLDIDASKPDSVAIEDPMPIGVGTSYGENMLIYTQKAGTLENGVISFPQRGLVLYVPEDVDGNYYYVANKYGRFAVDFRSDYTITVSVVDGEGAPLEQATVAVAAEGGMTAYTNSEGKATLDVKGLSGEEVQIIVYKDGFEGEDNFFTVTLGDESAITVEKAVVLTEATLTLTVKVMDNNEDEPALIADAWVYVNGGEYQTDENGSAVITIPGSEGFGKKLPVEVYKDGYNPWNGNADFTEGYEYYLPVVLDPAMCTFKLKVVDDEGEPVAGAMVMVTVDGNFDFDPDEDVTNENGEYSKNFPGMFGKSFDYMVMADGYQEFYGEGEWTESLDYYGVATLEKTVVAFNVVVKDKEGNPLEGALLEIGELSADTNAEGQATITLTGVEYYSVVDFTVSKDGYVAYTGQSFIVGEEVLERVFLEAEEAHVSFTVKDADGAAVADATVTLGETTATTDATGHAEFTLLAPAVVSKTVNYTVTKTGYKDYAGTVTFLTYDLREVVVLESDGTDGISIIEIENNADLKVYDLQGRLVKHPSVGNIYIVNDKKVRLMK